MERHLATVRIINSMKDIPGKDRIKLATMENLGWEVIVSVQDFSIGSKCVYFEVDSLLPSDKEWSQFLEKKNFKVKTMKMAGVISQGLCMPMSILPEGEYEEGQDVTEILGIKKFDEQLMDEIEMTARIAAKEVKTCPAWKRWMRIHTPKIYNLVFKKDSKRRLWPKFISKTDETRCEVLVNEMKKWREEGRQFLVTEKIDGQSATYYMKRGLFKNDFGVCSRNLQLFTPDNSSYWNIAKLDSMKDVLKKLLTLYGNSKYVILQGEIVGPGIQSNKYHYNEYHFFGFNLIVEDHGLQKHIDSRIARDLLRDYKIDWVPILANDYFLPQTMEEMKNDATARSVIYNTLREGVVLRNYDNEYDPISLKNVSREFLLQWKE